MYHTFIYIAFINPLDFQWNDLRPCIFIFCVTCGLSFYLICLLIYLSNENVNIDLDMLGSDVSRWFVLIYFPVAA